MISVNCVKGRLFRPKNDKSTDGLAFIILSQFKSMYLFKKKQTKKTHPLQLQLFKFKTSNCSLIIVYIPNQQTFDTPHYKNYGNI